MWRRTLTPLQGEVNGSQDDSGRTAPPPEISSTKTHGTETDYSEALKAAWRWFSMLIVVTFRRCQRAGEGGGMRPQFVLLTAAAVCWRRYTSSLNSQQQEKKNKTRSSSGSRESSRLISGLTLAFLFVFNTSFYFLKGRETPKGSEDAVFPNWYHRSEFEPKSGTHGVVLACLWLDIWAAQLNFRLSFLINFHFCQASLSTQCTGGSEGWLSAPPSTDHWTVGRIWHVRHLGWLLLSWSRATSTSPPTTVQVFCFFLFFFPTELLKTPWRHSSCSC